MTSPVVTSVMKAMAGNVEATECGLVIVVLLLL